MIYLKKISKENWEECIRLKVSEEQQPFIASNLYSIAEVQFLPNFEALAVYDEEMMVGFVMFGLDPDDNNYWIYRLMIDEKHQGKGSGKEALLEVIKRLQEKPDCKKVLVGYHPNNKLVDQLYKRVGFTKEGIAPWGEQLASYKIK